MTKAKIKLRLIEVIDVQILVHNRKYQLLIKLFKPLQYKISIKIYTYEYLKIIKFFFLHDFGCYSN